MSAVCLLRGKFLLIDSTQNTHYVVGAATAAAIQCISALAHCFRPLFGVELSLTDSLVSAECKFSFWNNRSK